MYKFLLKLKIFVLVLMATVATLYQISGCVQPYMHQGAYYSCTWYKVHLVIPSVAEFACKIYDQQFLKP